MNPNQEDKLLGIFRMLSSTDQASVTAFAEFLNSRISFVSSDAETQPFVPAEALQIPEPEAIDRPDDESVVAAVKRLSRSYFMLDKKKMLGVTSDLLTQHLLQGRDAGDVIDELEEIFRDHYQQLKKDESR